MATTELLEAAVGVGSIPVGQEHVFYIATLDDEALKPRVAFFDTRAFVEGHNVQIGLGRAGLATFVLHHEDNHSIYDGLQYKTRSIEGEPKQPELRGYTTLISSIIEIEEVPDGIQFEHILPGYYGVDHYRPRGDARINTELSKHHSGENGWLWRAVSSADAAMLRLSSTTK